MAEITQLKHLTLDEKLNNMKCEIASEFGIENYDSIDKGELSARTNGKIGGEMVRRLVEMGKQSLVEQRNDIKGEIIPISLKVHKVDLLQKRMNA